MLAAFGCEELTNQRRVNELAIAGSACTAFAELCASLSGERSCWAEVMSGTREEEGVSSEGKSIGDGRFCVELTF